MWFLTAKYLICCNIKIFLQWLLSEFLCCSCHVFNCSYDAVEHFLPSRSPSRKKFQSQYPGRQPGAIERRLEMSRYARYTLAKFVMLQPPNPTTGISMAKGTVPSVQERHLKKTGASESGWSEHSRNRTCKYLCKYLVCK